MIYWIVLVSIINTLNAQNIHKKVLNSSLSKTERGQTLGQQKFIYFDNTVSSGPDLYVLDVWLNELRHGQAESVRGSQFVHLVRYYSRWRSANKQQGFNSRIYHILQIKI